MTDTNTASAIDQMVAASISSPSLINSNTTPDMRLDRDGNVQVLGAALSPAVKDSPGLDLGAEVSGIDNDIARIEAELAEQRFDARSGAPKFVREGTDRSTREAMLVSLKAAREYQVARNAQLQAVRDADAAAKVQADREAAARHSFTQGSPQRAAALSKALTEEEAREAARVIVESRRG